MTIIVKDICKKSVERGQQLWLKAILLAPELQAGGFLKGEKSKLTMPI